MTRAKKPKKPPAYDWKNRKFPEDWNAHTFNAYLRDKHPEKFGIPYVTRNIRLDLGMIKNMLDEYGAEVLREFIDQSFELYRPSPRYPGINFPTMVRFYKARLIPRILSEQVNAKKREEPAEIEIVDIENILDLL
ncbi:hypothetical protein H1164_03985 [Thermoactinomyces daqus]|uniref:Uncharacterized protein n=1 Tax=Thermoactinomyces daqus TaxID=1329516 RepID=A0A7W1X8K2_9BACL|nr:hypothetical protein [Thermoactinomyces daqus]MBA4542060.1 hypothetical protein [Thermoactinomyces daqus]